MRLIYVSLPLSVALVAAGVYLATRPSPTIEGSLKDLPPRHPVTAAMLADSDRWKLKPAPAFQLQDMQGKSWDLAGLLGKPTVVLFIKDKCPCSEDAQPIFNAMADKFKGKVNFVGILDKSGADAENWAKVNKPRMTVLMDASLKTMLDFKALNSVYVYLLGEDGRIEKMWPGYWVTMLQELNEKLHAKLGQETVAFNTQYAPQEKSSGCTFGED